MARLLLYPWYTDSERNPRWLGGKYRGVLQRLYQLNMIQLMQYADDYEASITIYNTALDESFDIEKIVPDYTEYARMMEGESLIIPLWLLIDGTVEVTKSEEGYPYLEVNAVNSYGVEVHIVYDGTPLEAGVKDIPMCSISWA